MRRDETVSLQRSYNDAVRDLLVQVQSFANVFAPYGLEWAHYTTHTTGGLQDPALADRARQDAERILQQNPSGWDAVVALVRQTVWAQMLQELLEEEV